MPHVARVQPAVAEGLGRGLGVVQVAHRDLRPARADLARLTRAELAPGPVVVVAVEREDLGGCVGDEFAGGRRVLVRVVRGRVRGDAGRRLRGAVALAETGGGEVVLEERDDLGADGGAAGGPAFDDALEGWEVRAGDGVFDEADEDWGN